MVDSRIGNCANVVEISDNIFMFANRTVGQHDNVYEGEVRSSVYGVRPCVIKFATLSEQNVREAEILTKLGSHTNVIAIIQSGTYCDVFEDRVYIALDKCHNENLRQYLANRKAAGIEFDLDQAIDFAKQIIVGVMYIHDNNVIHLDLKPSNILISLNLHLIKIADFGLSIIVKSSKSKVFYKRQFGTNGYRPIESFGNGEVSMRTDIFSLGTVLLHLLSNGNNVFGRDEHVFLHNVTNDITNTSGLLVGNPDTTEHLIKCMVSKERCRRPTIWEVSDHPCWDGKEMECNFEYFADDEIEDSEIGKTDDVEDIKIKTQTDIDKEREFLNKMREMGFNRKPTIVLLEVDWTDYRLYRVDHKHKSVMKIGQHTRPNPGNLRTFSVFSLGEYIYFFYVDRSVYRLEYCDATASWEKMNDCIGDHGHFEPPVIASSNSIFLVAEFLNRFTNQPSKSVSKYNPSMDEWELLNDKPTRTFVTALLCNDEYLYCVGFFNVSREIVNVVERMDLKTSEWKRIGSFLTLLQPVESAVECRGNIYFVECDGDAIVIDAYDPTTNQLTTMTRMDGRDLPLINSIKIKGKVAWGRYGRSNAFEIDGNFFVVRGCQLYKYDVAENDLSFVMNFPHLLTVLVKLSA